MPAVGVDEPGRTTSVRPYWLLVYLPLALMLNEVYSRTVDKPNYQRQLVIHGEILAARSQRPYNTRVLQPLIVQGLVDSLPWGSEESRFLIGYAVIRTVSLFATFCVAERVLALYGRLETARLCVLFLAGMEPFTFLRCYYQPTAVLDLACFTAGMYFIISGPRWPLVPLVVLATANRNTSAFICLAYGLYHLDALWNSDRAARRRFVAMCLLLGATWALEIALLEWRYPADSWLKETFIGFRANLTDDLFWKYFTMMCVPLAASIYLGWPAASAAMKRMVLWAALYLGVHLFMARAFETRYYLNLYVGLGPFCVLAYDRFARGAGGSQGA